MMKIREDILNWRQKSFLKQTGPSCSSLQTDVVLFFFSFFSKKSPAVYILSPVLDGLWREKQRVCEQATVVQKGDIKGWSKKALVDSAIHTKG